MKIGLLGGSFDPPHLAHLAMARVGLAWGLDEVWLIPAATPPHKRELNLTSPWDRYALCALAAAHEPGILPCALELARGGVSYTIDTLRELAAVDPDRELVLLLGQDNWHTIGQWKAIADFPQFARVMVFGRDDSPVAEIPPAVERGAILIPEFGMPLSSTAIRGLIAEGDDRWQTMVPALVVEYIARQGLYGARVLGDPLPEPPDQLL